MGRTQKNVKGKDCKAVKEKRPEIAAGRTKGGQSVRMLHCGDRKVSRARRAFRRNLAARRRCAQEGENQPLRVMSGKGHCHLHKRNEGG